MCIVQYFRKLCYVVLAILYGVDVIQKQLISFPVAWIGKQAESKDSQGRKHHKFHGCRRVVKGEPKSISHRQHTANWRFSASALGAQSQCLSALSSPVVSSFVCSPHPLFPHLREITKHFGFFNNLLSGFWRKCCQSTQWTKWILHGIIVLWLWHD